MNGTLYDMALDASTVLRHYLTRIVEAAPVVLGAIILLLLFWVGGKYAARMAVRAIARTGAEPHVVRILERTIWYVFIGLGVVTSLGTVGADQTAPAAPLQVAGFAICFPHHHRSGNLLACLTLKLPRPFKTRPP